MSTTSSPAAAVTCAMPAPMKPAPTTPIFFSFEAGSLAGRRAPLFSSCIDTNSERIIAAASFERTILANQRDSMRSAVSIGTCRPS